MNVKMAVRMAQKMGITVKTVVANDDVASDVYKRQPLTCKQLLSHCFIGAFDCINYYEYRDRVFRTETPKQQHSKKSFGYGNGI